MVRPKCIGAERGKRPEWRSRALYLPRWTEMPREGRVRRQRPPGVGEWAYRARGRLQPLMRRVVGAVRAFHALRVCPGNSPAMEAWSRSVKAPPPMNFVAPGCESPSVRMRIAATPAIIAVRQRMAVSVRSCRRIRWRVVSQLEVMGGLSFGVSSIGWVDSSPHVALAVQQSLLVVRVLGLAHVPEGETGSE